MSFRDRNRGLEIAKDTECGLSMIAAILFRYWRSGVLLICFAMIKELLRCRRNKASETRRVGVDKAKITTSDITATDDSDCAMQGLCKSDVTANR